MTRYRHTLRLAGRDVPIYVQRQLRGKSWGYSCYSPRRSLRLLGRLVADTRAETMLHECLHQADDMYRIRLGRSAWRSWKTPCST